MSEKSRSSAGGTRRAGAPWRRGESQWSRSRERAAYAASVDQVQGLIAWRIH